MRRSIEQRTVRSFCRRQPRINVRPDYQRGAVWSQKRKQLMLNGLTYYTRQAEALWFRLELG